MANFQAKPATRQLALDALMRDEDEASARVKEIDKIRAGKTRRSQQSYKEEKRRLAEVMLSNG